MRWLEGLTHLQKLLKQVQTSVTNYRIGELYGRGDFFIHSNDEINAIELIIEPTKDVFGNIYVQDYLERESNNYLDRKCYGDYVFPIYNNTNGVPRFYHKILNGMNGFPLFRPIIYSYTHSPLAKILIWSQKKGIIDIDSLVNISNPEIIKFLSAEAAYYEDIMMNTEVHSEYKDSVKKLKLIANRVDELNKIDDIS